MKNEKLKSIYKIIKNRSSLSLRKKVKLILKNLRIKRNLFYAIKLGKVVSKEEIISTLNSLGMKKGDTILVHSSLSRIGYIENGTQTVLEALQTIVGENGTIGVPTFWGLTRDYLSGYTTYDVQRSKSYLGAFTEKIRTHPNALRSLHPTHSAAFIGPNAEFLTCDHHLDKTPFGPHSPFQKLRYIDGKILLFGVDIEYVTNLHTIEETINKFPINVYRDKRIIFDVITKERKTLKVESSLHCTKIASNRNSLKLLPYFNKYNVIKDLKLGEGRVKIINANKLHKILTHLYHLGITMYS